MTTNRQLWNDAKAGHPDAVVILEADGAWHVYGEDAVAVRYAMGFEESKHPRDPSGTSEGGQFAGGEKVPGQNTIKLFRAGKDDILTGAASFSPDIDVARAYLDNPGFGGPTLYETDVEIDPEELLDIYDSYDQVAAIIEASGLDINPGAVEADWLLAQEQVIEALVDAGITWVRLRDTFPEGAETYTWLYEGDDPELEPYGENPQRNAKRFTANQLNTALEELTSRGTQVVFAQKNAQGTLFDIGAEGAGGAGGSGHPGIPSSQGPLRAPRGGVNIKGKFYPGGQWIPKGVVSQLTPQQRQQVEQGKSVQQPGKPVKLPEPRPLLDQPQKADPGEEYKRLGTKAPAFKEWFGESQVVDEDGKPLVVYHGTSKGDFDAFRSTKFQGIAGYFHTDRQFSDALTRPWYASQATSRERRGFATQEDVPREEGAELYEVYLSIKNPLDLRHHDPNKTMTFSEFITTSPQLHASKTWTDEIAKYGDQPGKAWGWQATTEVTEWAKQSGFDGVFVSESDKGHSIIAFEPSQIKSTDNAGTFDPSDERMKHAAKYAADPWTSYTGPKGGKGWINSQTGRVFYGPNKPGVGEPGEEVAAPPAGAGPQVQPGAPPVQAPPQPTMENPIPLPPGVAKGLGASPASGVPNFTEPPGAAEGATPEWGTTESLAGLYGRDNMSPQTAQRFNVSAAKAMGLEIPEGNPEQQAQLAEEFLRHNAAQLAQTMNAAESMGWKPRGKRLITNAGSAARWLVGQAESQGYARQGGDMASELTGAVNHLQDSEQAIQANPGLQAATEAFGKLTKLVGPLLALPLAVAYGYLNKGGTSAVAGANQHLDQLSERLGIRSPFAPQTRVEPKPEKPKAGPRLPASAFEDEPRTARPPGTPPEPKAVPAKTTTRQITPEDLPEASPKAPAARTRRQQGAEIAAETQQENARLLQETVDQMPEAVRADFTTQYKVLLDDRSQEINKIRTQRDELLTSIAGSKGMGVMTRQIQRADDPAQVKGFDLLVQLVENAPGTYADLVGVGELGQSAGDIETRLFDVLKKPKGYFQAPQPHEVASELASEWQRQETAAEERTASAMAAEEEVAGFDPSSDTFGEGPAVDPDEFDPQAEPFAKKYGFPPEFTNRKTHPFMAKVIERIAKKYGFKESEHPREEKGKAEGGRFSGSGKSSGKPSQTNSPAFREWFGESKVVDEQEQPLRVFHGTQSDLKGGAFDISAAGSSTDAGYLGQGFYFGSIEDANVYAGKKGEPGQVLPVYLSIKNPLALGFRREGRREVDREIVVRSALGLSQTATAADVTAEAKQQGYDGITYRDPFGGTEYNVFDPTQIKSATGNRGTFSPDDPRINYARDPYAQKFARDLSTGKLPNLSQMEDPEATIAEADRVLAKSARLTKAASSVV